MTEDQKRVKIAEATGQDDRWLIVKRGLYYRPGAAGYTSTIHEAWIVTEAEADEHVYPHDEPVSKRRAPLPDYFHDLNDCAAMEATLTDEEFGTYHDILLNEINSSRFISATAAQRAEAFGRVKGLWE